MTYTLGLVCFIMFWGFWIGGDLLGFYLFPMSEFGEPVGAVIGFCVAIGSCVTLASLDTRLHKANSD